MKFKKGDLIVYKNMIGKIKRINGSKAFIWFHTGDTAALTNLDDCIQDLLNKEVEE